MARLILTAAALALTTVASAQQQRLFDFHSAFWMNLHTYLHALARTARPIVDPLPEAATAQERAQWDAAVAAYRERYGKKSLLFDMDLVRLTARIAHAESRPMLEGVDMDAETRTLLESVAPIYRRHRWPAHDAANRKFIASLQPMLDAHGAAIAARLAKSYSTTWPERPIRTDVVHNAGGPGNAHTTIGPTHITIAATDPRHQGFAGLELMFHEASHGLDDVLTKGVTSVTARLGVTEPRNLWHAILFFNAGAITADVLAAAGIRDYRMYMEVNKVFADLYPRVAKHWPAFLAAEISRDEAITRILKELAVK